MSKWFLKTLFFVLLASMPVAAQTASDLEQKYGPRDNHLVRRAGFTVRPEVVMTPSFTLDGQVCEVVIEPKRTSESYADWHKGMSPALAREIIEEIVPAELRNKQTRGITFGNYSSVNLVEHDKVSIYKYMIGVGRPEAELKITEIRIKWKERQCH